MTDFSLPKPIAITITSGVKGQPVTIRNMTTGEAIYTTIPEDEHIVVDLQNLSSGYTAGDIINITVSGEKVGSGTVTTTSTDEPQSVTISTSTLTSGLFTRGI